jgi:hypothetical protein
VLKLLLRLSLLRNAVKLSNETVGSTIVFFKLTSKTKVDNNTKIRVIFEPDDAFGLSLMINHVAESSVSCKNKLAPHKSLAVSRALKLSQLSVSKSNMDSKSGYALTVGRGEDFISVPVPRAKFVFAGEFLRALATDQCWVECVEKISKRT